ncbi:hypothetical protein MMC13_005956 [Lambiella insularis]|nr:hypothetical protein [Lambiella insularis]
MITISVLSVLLCIIAFVQCNPPSTIWTQKPGARCWSGNVQSDFGIFHGSWNALIDFALALLPVTVLWDMQMDIKKKIGLSSLLSLGNLAGIAASVRTSKLIAFLETGDLTWETFDLDAWAASEIFLIILSGSAPTFTPIYKRFRKHNAYITHEQENSGRGFRRTSSYMMDTKKSSPIRQQSSGSGLHTATSTIVAAHIEQDHWSDSDSHTVDASNGLDFYQALELDPGEGAPRPGPSKEQPESNSAMVHGEEIV